MEYRKLTLEELKKITSHLIGKDRVVRGTCILGYTDFENEVRFVTEIHNDSCQMINIEITNESFNDFGYSGDMVIGYIRRKMEEVMPGFLCKKSFSGNSRVSVSFQWY